MTTDCEFHIDILRQWHVHEVDFCIKLIVRLGHVEGITVARRKIVEARAVRAVLWIAVIIVLLVTLLAMMSGHTLGRAITSSCFVVTIICLAVA